MTAVVQDNIVETTLPPAEVRPVVNVFVAAPTPYVSIYTTLAIIGSVDTIQKEKYVARFNVNVGPTIEAKNTFFGGDFGNSAGVLLLVPDTEYIADHVAAAISAGEMRYNNGFIFIPQKSLRILQDAYKKHSYAVKDSRALPLFDSFISDGKKLVDNDAFIERCRKCDIPMTAAPSTRNALFVPIKTDEEPKKE